MTSAREGDIIWEGTDPLGRKVYDLQSVHDARFGKHGGPEMMTDDEMHTCIVSPDRIDVSSHDQTRCNYYRFSPQDGKPPYDRVTVSFADSILAPDGVAISWSKYGKPVGGNTIYETKEGEP